MICGDDVLIAKSGAGTLAAAVAGCTGAVAGSSGAADGSPAAAAGSYAAVAGSSGAAADIRLGAVADVVPDTLASGRGARLFCKSLRQGIRSVVKVQEGWRRLVKGLPRGAVVVEFTVFVLAHRPIADPSSSLRVLADLAAAQRLESPARMRAQGSPVNMLAQGSPGRRVGLGSPGRTIAQESPAYTPVAQHRTHLMAVHLETPLSQN
eukprot:CAMPEP_0194487584 /NCGR_PEP_ID=MMETSP0253-20130528/7821_1 /TAXON_ID=2966 /ORGANISM="Noctiluca scintillans" /LENGTH=207 /DNA_ID=CAMNT_0039327829 /DNA_START=181 /DNA_END=805 /DNA_ORIENTATION=+